MAVNRYLVEVGIPHAMPVPMGTRLRRGGGHLRMHARSKPSLTRVTAVEFVGRAESGRTKPLVLSCTGGPSDMVEVYCKLSGSCDEDVCSLTREVVATHLAAGLSLPVPKPYLVEIPPQLADAVRDQNDARRIRASSTIAYGSARVPNRFSTWYSGWQVSSGVLPVVLLAFAFDAVIENLDRRPRNPNCLVSGHEIFLIDHELAFTPSQIEQKSPWELGGLQHLKDNEKHIFRRELVRKSRILDFKVLRDQWTKLDEGYLSKCRSVVPQEWAGGREVAERAITQVCQAKENIDGLIEELRRILK